MKLYVVYFRTMQDSPEVEIKCVTTSKFIAKLALNRAQREAEEWMADEDEDSGNWAEACIQECIKGDGRVKPGDQVFVVTDTEWVESIETMVMPFLFKKFADMNIEVRKSQIRNLDPDIVPFDEDETFDESMHLHNPGVMSDYYFSVEPVIVQ